MERPTPVTDDTTAPAGTGRNSREGSGRAARRRLFLGAAAQVLGEEPLGHCEELHAVLGFGEAVALVVEEEVLVVDSLVLHGVDDLLGLGLLHPGVVGALGDEDRD